MASTGISTKKVLVISGVTLLAGALVYFMVQYRKVMSYVLNFKGIKIKDISANKVAFNLDVEFVNNSDLNILLKSQKYDVFLNNKFVSSGGSSQKTKLKPKGGTIITNLVSFNPTNVLKALETNWAQLLFNPKSVSLRIDYNVKASLWGIPIPIKNTYSITVAELQAMRNANK